MGPALRGADSVGTLQESSCSTRFDSCGCSRRLRRRPAVVRCRRPTVHKEYLETHDAPHTSMLETTVVNTSPLQGVFAKLAPTLNTVSHGHLKVVVGGWMEISNRAQATAQLHWVSCGQAKRKHGCGAHVFSVVTTKRVTPLWSLVTSWNKRSLKSKCKRLTRNLQEQGWYNRRRGRAESD